jgi:carbon-monoxide dehydrogenase medium subunit
VKPAAFDFHAPETEAEILALLAEHGDDARLLAGGQSLVPLMNMRIVKPGVLISINRCRAFDYIEAEGGTVSIGPLTRQAGAEREALVRGRLPLMAMALPHVGVTASRNRGTVCGSLAHADPLAELPSIAAALEATFVLADAESRREVAAEEFFVNILTTAVEAGEMLREVRFPSAPEGSRDAFLKVGNRAHGFAVAGIAARLEGEANGTCGKARLAAMGMGETTIRLLEAEHILEEGGLGAASVAAASAAASACVDPFEDIHADAQYRRRLAGVLVKRAVEQAFGPLS